MGQVKWVWSGALGGDGVSREPTGEASDLCP